MASDVAPQEEECVSVAGVCENLPVGRVHCVITADGQTHGHGDKIERV